MYFLLLSPILFYVFLVQEKINELLGKFILYEIERMERCFIKVHAKYIIAFIILFLIETVIALFIHDAIIRPYIGDVLVVILMYTFIRGFIGKIKNLPLYLLFFASGIEVLQYFHLVDKLNLQNTKVISIILGSSFDIKDIFCYLAGSVILIIWEKLEKDNNRCKRSYV